VLRSGELVAEVEDGLDALWRDEADAAAATEGLREATNTARHEEARRVLDDLRTDYARLFTGPGLAVVAGFESQYAAGLGDPAAPVFTAVTAAVEKMLAEEGIRASAGQPPDRAAAEVEFLYHLSAREASAWLDGDRSEAKRLRVVRDRFIVLHAGAWLPILADDLGLAARPGLYAGLATLLGSFLRTELAAISPASGQGR
jgi:TorA maturation chaperone TorD